MPKAAGHSRRPARDPVGSGSSTPSTDDPIGPTHERLRGQAREAAWKSGGTLETFGHGMVGITWLIAGLCLLGAIAAGADDSAEAAWTFIVVGVAVLIQGLFVAYVSKAVGSYIVLRSLGE